VVVLKRDGQWRSVTGFHELPLCVAVKLDMSNLARLCSRVGEKLDNVGARRRTMIEARSDMNIRRTEQIVLVIGLALLATWIGVRLHGSVASKAAIAQFETEEAANADEGAPLSDPALGSNVDFRLWSVKRVAAYKDSLTKKTDSPLAILRIPKIKLEVPIFNDTDDLTLNRGVGRILGTAQVGQPGNLGIAGHRDGFFRGLQSIATGDAVELARPGHRDRYTVTQIRIVTPEDTYVLQPTPGPTLTLVTCFPFYFVGNAPKRYVVTASLESARQSDLSAHQDPIFTGRNIKIRRRKDDRN
jgi:sortase A